MRPLSGKPAEAAPPRMAAMAKLPIFFDLRGKRCVVSGGGAGASWKAELLAAAGAEVDIYADELGEEARDLLARGAASGVLRHVARGWTPDDLRGATLAIGDCETEDDARAFADAAHAAGAPVNTIDRPATCDFQFGSIVNRSPVVIGIATDGVAPILAQAIRGRIEALLPRNLAQWGDWARSIRGRVMTQLAKGPQRRAFWERIAAQALRGARPPALDGAQARSMLREAGAARAGSVALVGAGPGDPDLLTAKAIRALQGADVVLFDDLVSDEVLETARREARRICVGKRANRQSCPQGEIETLMIRLAREGLRVVRLKSGDPMVFGRAGEEIDALERAQIDVEVIPGVTAAQAMAAATRCSLTHRDHAQTVSLVTGRARDGALPAALDWTQAASGRATTICYMSGRTAGEIRRGLIASGASPQTPCVVMSALTRQDEQEWAGPLAGLESGVAAMQKDAPVLLGIGWTFAAVAQRHATRLIAAE